MEKIISCCGVVCSDCDYFPGDCAGCPEIRGAVFWLQFTGGAVCPIYDCCVGQMRLAHCGRCSALPCARYLEGDGDPTKTPEENQRILAGQLALLKSLK